VIRGYLKTMLPAVDGEAQPELREELAILDEEAAACQRIVEDLLSYAREPVLEREPVTAAQLLDDALRRFKSTAQGRELEIDVVVEDALLELDPLRMQQVLANLLRNAADASRKRAPIELRGRTVDACYRIEVRDRGPGIAADRRERVFEPFFSERRGGSGLGLAVSRGIVEAHAGRIYVDPSVSEGARLIVELPITPHQTQQDQE